MRIAIVASGSRGDVQPYVALGTGLRDAGHAVRVLTSDDFTGLVEDAGLEFCSSGSSIEGTLQSPEWRDTIEGGNFLKIMARMTAEMKKRAAGMARDLPPLFSGTDLVITGINGMGGPFAIAEKLGIPAIQAYVFPITPTRAFASPLTPTLPLGAILNRPSFYAMRMMLYQTGRIVNTTIRHDLGMPKESFLGPFRSLKERRVPVMYGYSQHVLPRPSDWDDLTQVAGYWFLDPATDWVPPVDVVDFLRAGAPPVYIGFGSMSNRNPEETTQLVLKALALSGQRGVLASGWGGMSQADLPETVHMIASIPHSWLFPQLGAVVHHGGAGTTAAGLRAGVPSIITPFFGDQPFWGQRVLMLGVGPAPIPKKKLTTERLAAAITQAMNDNAMRGRAAALGARIRSEDGIGRAVALVRQFAG